MTNAAKYYQFNSSTAFGAVQNLRFIVDLHSEKAEEVKLIILPKVGISRYFDKICLLLVSI